MQHPDVRFALTRARSRLHATDLDRLRSRGYWRDQREYEFIVTYPPLPALSEGEAYFIKKGSSGRKQLSLYVHIPFCTTICTFCGRFVREVARSNDRIRRYLSYLSTEIELWRRVVETQDHVVTSLYFGGGTPTAVPVSSLVYLVQLTRSAFNCARGVEVTVETSPELVTRGYLAALHDSGVSRLSIGAQSWHDDALRLCGRAHTAAQIEQAFTDARAAGFANINIDLLLGLPQYTTELFAADLKRTLALRPECVTVYPLYIQPSSAMSKLSRSLFADTETMMLWSLFEREFMASASYTEFPVHYFVRSPERVLRQWRDRWESGTELIGIGVSSYGFFNRTQYHNHMRLGDYAAAVGRGALPIWRFATLDNDELIRRRLVFQTKTGRIGAELPMRFPKLADELQGLGLVTAADGGYALSEVGRLFSEEICLRFYSARVQEAIAALGFRYAGYLNKPSLYYHGAESRPRDQPTLDLGSAAPPAIDPLR
jgi:oxygen-independent coproporphyrinogen-3 oxidase